MIVGILSDTHGDDRAMAAGMAALTSAGAEFFIHCGDVGEESVIDQFAGVPHLVIWGNNDLDRRRLSDYAASIGVTIQRSHAELELGGKRFVVTHGDDAAFLSQTLDAQACDYLMFGHTHVPADERRGRIRAINPGALHRARQKTVAILNTADDQLTLLPVT